MSSDLASWLLEQIAEQESMARKLERRAQEHALHIQDPNLLGRVIPGWHDWPDVEAMAHRVAAECEAKRKIIALHGYDESRYDDEDEPRYCLTCGDSDYEVGPYPCDTLRLLALPFADRPGYQEKWRP